MRFYVLFGLFSMIFSFYCQPILDLKEIMKGQDFTGYWPESPAWNLDGTAVYFRWNKDGKEGAEPYRYTLKTSELKEMSEVEFGDVLYYDPNQSTYPNQLSVIQQSLVLTDRKSLSTIILFQSDHFISDIHRCSSNEATLRLDGDFFLMKFDGFGMKSLSQLTRYVEPKKKKQADSTEMQKQQVALFQYIRDHNTKDKKDEKSKFETVKETQLPGGFGEISGRYLSNFKSEVLIRKDEAASENSTLVPHFITADGFVNSSEARSKVSKNEPNQEMYLHFINKDTLFKLDFSLLTDIRRKPSYMDTVGGILFPEDRPLFIHDPVFGQIKNFALLDVRASDNKDRWIVLVDLETGKTTEVEHQHDEAWIGGPGISEWNMETATLGFVQQDEVIYFQSEEKGFSQLYELNLATKTKGLVYPVEQDFEMMSVTLSSDGMRYFVLHNLFNPGVLQYSWLHRIHKKMVPVISNLSGGIKDIAVSPNEEYFAYLGSSANSPWELYIQQEKAKKIKITSSTTENFNAYPWRNPDIIQFTASDGQKVHSRLYLPDKDKQNGAAVLFVHGAGYLQNAHSWWSHYYREYMFHNLLVDQGYTVLDVDYRASAGYGRDYRTAIYRHMGGRDVQDFIDAIKYLTQFNIDTNRVGIYGGSYGGFVTLMGLFQHPTSFACGAALRSVTDWAHYNHEYTSNILNYPETDPVAYKKSSPIYYAEGLEKPLLMLHGMVDDNVQFQDIVRLQQRLIELGKTQWELASYPVEAHGFKEAYSWHDEYRRIYELFQTHLIKK